MNEFFAGMRIWTSTCFVDYDKPASVYGLVMVFMAMESPTKKAQKIGFISGSVQGKYAERGSAIGLCP